MHNRVGHVTVPETGDDIVEKVLVSVVVVVVVVVVPSVFSSAGKKLKN
jgi:hypothetical protein